MLYALYFISEDFDSFLGVFSSIDTAREYAQFVVEDGETLDDFYVDRLQIDVPSTIPSRIDLANYEL